MTLWFDVSDVQHWTRPYLTGIQRTVVSVLAELLSTRKDIQLFVYEHSDKTLRKADIHSLPSVVRDCIFFAQETSGGCAAVDNAAFVAVSDARPDRVGSEALAAVAPATDGGLSARIRGAAARASRRIKTGIRRQPRKWLGADITNALKDCIRSVLNLLRVVRRKVSVKRGGVVPLVPAAPANVRRESILFKRGDVCVSLSATWGLPHYGEVIAANKRQSGVKYVSMIYDLIPTLFPQWMLASHSHFITLWVRQQIENADTLLTISKFQKEEISQFIVDEKLPARPIEVVRLGDDPNFMNAIRAGDSLPLPRYVPDRKFAICVSTLDIRKNQAILYQVWQRLAEELGDQCPQLLLIGTPHLHVTDLLYQMRNDRLVNRLIIVLTDITDEELAWYYKHCEFTLYPSIYEGWGLPISESLAVGKYCIAGNKTSLPEAGGDLVDYFDPFDFVGCHKLVYRAVTDPEYVKRREELVRENYKPYSWAMTASHISKIVDRIADTHSLEEGQQPAISRQVDV